MPVIIAVVQRQHGIDYDRWTHIRWFPSRNVNRGTAYATNAFAHGINLIAGSKENLQHNSNKITLARWAREYRMKFITEKTKVFPNCRTMKTVSIGMNGDNLNQVSYFKYLGATLTEDGNNVGEVYCRIAWLIYCFTAMNLRPSGSTLRKQSLLLNKSLCGDSVLIRLFSALPNVARDPTEGIDQEANQCCHERHIGGEVSLHSESKKTRVYHVLGWMRN